MLNLQKFFKGVGKIVVFKDTCTYRVDKLKDILDIIIPHFNKYSLVSQKLADYILFKEIVSLMEKKEHLTLSGIKTILSYKSSLNLGLSDELKAKFPGIKAAKRPLVIDMDIPSAFWVAGFTTGDGSFSLVVRSKELSGIARIDIEFSITQHTRDLLLLHKFIAFFNCGRIKKDSRYNVHYYVVTETEGLSNKIIPLFNKYPVKGVKSLNFVD